MRRRMVLLLTTMAAALVVVSGVALAANITCQAGVPCFGTRGNDTITGSAVDDPDMRGRAGNDVLRGQGGNDGLNGGPDRDRLYGGENNDGLNGGLDDDQLYGEANDDRYSFFDVWGKDTIDDDSGINTLSFTGVTTPLRLDLVASRRRDEARSGRNTLNFPTTTVFVEADGGEDDDSISGTDRNEGPLNGNAGDDTLAGRGGADTLSGGDGDDRIDGGSGADDLQGDSGNDTILAKDNEIDNTIDCGEGNNDTVYFDSGLEVPSNCEVQNP